MNRTLLSFCLFCSILPQLRAQLLPPGLPQVTMVRHDGSLLCDYMFTELLNWNSSTAPDLALMFDQNGEVVWYTSNSIGMTNFALQPNGQMSYFQLNEHYLLDSDFNIVSGIACSSYINDAHDLHITTDGRIFVICVESDIEDLSSINTANGDPGSPNAYVFSTVIQELDQNLDPVREWKARPHYQITDSDPVYFTTPNRLDLNHPNSLDWDGRYLLVSQRHNNEIICLDWEAGQIAWRLGGSNNQFAFVNDQGTKGQHDARFLPGGKISVFDNGAFHTPPLTRGLVYQLDTVAMTATRIAEYPLSGAVSQAMGGFRVLPNGDVLRANGWFEPDGFPNISLIHANGLPALDVYFSPANYNYRAQCFSPSWQIDRPRVQCEPFGNGLRLFLDQPYPDYLWNTGETSASIVVQDTGRYQVFVPKGVGRLGSYEFHVPSLDGSCPVVSSPEASTAPTRPGKLLQIVDLLGREVRGRQVGQVYIEVYSDGRRKVVRVE